MPPPLPRLLGAALAGAVVLLAWLAWQRVPEPKYNPASRPAAATPAPVPTKRPAAETTPAQPPAPADQSQALKQLLAGQPFVLLENGRPTRFQLSLNEVFLPHEETGQRLHQIAPQADAKALIVQASQAAEGKPSGWVLYPAGHPEAAHRRILSHRLLLQSASDPATLQPLLARTGLRAVDGFSNPSGQFIIAEAISGDPAIALAALPELSSHPAIQSAAPQLLRQHAKKLLPDDTLFSQQWHLKNTGQGGGKLGTDINVTTVWDTYLGQGMRIGIVDDGLETTHPDLADNADTVNDYDWNGLDNDPTPNAANDDTHGTPAAGIAAARGNNTLGVSGVAPRAQLVGFRLIADFTTDQQDAQAMSLHNDIIQVKSNSWGQPDAPWETFPPGTQFENARKQAVTTGRGGLGTIFVWAAGNGRGIGDQGNKDGISNSMYALTIGALGNNGALASYSETGAHLTAVAPASGGTRDITTTDLVGADGLGGLADLNYTGEFGGTSASAPVVAGVAALMLQANPNLNWRDVKEILLRSATKIFPTDTGWVTRTGGDSPALPPIKHHQSYGGGLVNAQAAVDLATTWTSLGAAVEVSRTQTFVPPYQPIADNSTTGVTIPLDFTAAAPMRVEHVQVTVHIEHTYRGDLQITLRSPGGIVSTLATKEVNDDSTEGYYDWTFSSMRHWGESAQGIWEVTVKDLAAADTGRIISARVNLHGTAAAPAQITSVSDPALLLAEGAALSLSAQTSGYGNLTRQWRLGTTLVDSDADYAVAAAAMANAGTYQFTSSNLTGTDTVSVPMGVVRRAVPAATVNEGVTAVLKTVTAGPGLTCHWFKNGNPMSDDGRITGSGTATLTVKNTVGDDEDTYTCVVTQSPSGLILETLPTAITIRRKPIVSAPTVTNGVVSGGENYLFTATGSPTRYAATGVPTGMKFDTKSGALTGRPSTAKTYTIKVTASNAAGTSAPAEVTWTVEPFPTSAVGVFSGIVERQADLNGGLGGRLTITVTKTGSLTGTLTLGAKPYPLTGRVDALPGNANPSIHLTLKRTTGLSPLALDLDLSLANGSLTGTVGADGHQAVVTARRNPWSTASKAPGHPAAYNAVLQPAASNPENPQGEGYAILTTTATGGATWAGKLADGTGLTGGVTFDANGEVPLHLTLYTGTGSIQGWSTVNSATSMLDGAVDWFKAQQPIKSTTRNYKTGFLLHTLNLIGAKYTKPPANTPVLALPVTPNNARLTFSSGGLSAPLAQDLTITATNTVKMPTGVLNPQLVRLTLNASTGLISGGFTLKDNDPTDTTAPITVVPRTPTFNGLLITRPGFNQGRGHFLLNELPTLVPVKTTPTTSPTLSGQVVFGPP